MKLRIQDNSIRFRLTRSEVDQLDRDGSVIATTSFPGGGSLEYAVESSPDADRPSAGFFAERIQVRIPRPVVQHWAGSEEISITGHQPLAQGELAILVEKDFACLTPREGEDEADMFPHPLQGQENC